MLTGDLNIVDVEWIIQYKIVNPSAWLFNVKEKRQTIRDISQSVINTLVGDRAILDVMGIERSSIQNQAQIKMNEYFEQLAPLTQLANEIHRCNTWLIYAVHG